MSRVLNRRRLWLFPAALLLLAALLLAARSPALAQEDGQAPLQAGLVIVTGSDEPATYCVELAPDETITGNELLQRAGVRVVADQNAMGATICSLNGTGCAFPAESCFCQCMGTPCTYWSYWRQDEAGAWQYAIAGAANTRIRTGTVEGWVWGEGTTQSAASPPAVTLGEICGDAAAGPVAAGLGDAADGRAAGGCKPRRGLAGSCWAATAGGCGHCGVSGCRGCAQVKQATTRGRWPGWRRLW